MTITINNVDVGKKLAIVIMIFFKKKLEFYNRKKLRYLLVSV